MGTAPKSATSSHAEHSGRRADEHPGAHEEQVKDRSTQSAPEEVEREGARTHHMLEPRTEQQQHIHVQREMQHAEVHEHVRHGTPDRPPLKTEYRERVSIAHHRALQKQHRDGDCKQHTHTAGQPRCFMFVVLEWSGHRTVLLPAA